MASSSSPSTSRYAATACAVCPCVSSRTAASARTTADASAVHSRSAIARELDDALPRAVLRRWRRGEQDVEAEEVVGMRMTTRMRTRGPNSFDLSPECAPESPCSSSRAFVACFRRVLSSRAKPTSRVQPRPSGPMSNVNPARSPLGPFREKSSVSTAFFNWIPRNRTLNALLPSSSVSSPSPSRLSNASLSLSLSQHTRAPTPPTTSNSAECNAMSRDLCVTSRDRLSENRYRRS